MSSDCFVILAMADITVHSLPLIGFPDFGIDANASNADRAIRSLWSIAADKIVLSRLSAGA